MNHEAFKNLYDRRIKYPLGVVKNHENVFDIKYIKDEIELQSSSDLLFLLLTGSHLDRPQLKEVREQLKRSYHMVGVFGVGDILNPVTGVNFTLYVFSRSQPNKVWFGELLKNKHPFKHRKAPDMHMGIIEVPFGELEPYFNKYLDSIDLAVHGDKKDDYIHDVYRVFGVSRDKLENRTDINYYRPELIEAETKLAHEEMVRLGDIAEIIAPRESTEGRELYSVSLKDAKYPLKPDALVPVRESARIAFVKRYDVITNTFLGSAFLNLTKRPDLVIANTQIIIRVHDKRFSPAYVATYLNSSRMKTYFERHKRGTIIQQIKTRDLLEFEIVLPSKQTNESAQSFLESLTNYDGEKSKLQAINKLLFSESATPSRPLQNELLSEIHEELQLTKNNLVRELFESDLHEIETCYKAGAYKGCLALCGSLLETLVLDWLSEIDNKDYFVIPEITELRQLISKLHEAEAITVQEQQFANEIRKRRNLIHPKNYIENTPLHKEVCEEVMHKLKPLVQKRYNYDKESN